MPGTLTEVSGPLTALPGTSPLTAAAAVTTWVGSSGAAKGGVATLQAAETKKARAKAARAALRGDSLAQGAPGAPPPSAGSGVLLAKAPEHTRGHERARGANGSVCFDCPVVDRTAWFGGLAPSEAKVLEIGPLHHPVLTKRSHRVTYVDHATTDELRSKYASDLSLRDQIDAIVEVDLVWKEGSRLSEVAGDDAPYDFVVASHVVEHVPDLIGWLEMVAEVLAPGGRLLLAVPDKRFTFDINRPLTEMADLVEAHLSEQTRPSFRQVYDFWSRIVAVDAGHAWLGDVDYSGMVRGDTDDAERDAYQRCLAYRETGGYTDVHCHVFTDGSFLDLFARLARLDLVSFKIAALEPTAAGTLEFFVALEICSLSAPLEAGRAEKLASVARASQRLAAVPGRGSAAGGEPLELSDRETTLILMKRKVIGALRRSLGTAPRRC